MTRTRLYLAVTGFGNDPDAVTRLLGLAPTRLTVRGERVGSAGQRIPTRELWALDSPLADSSDFEAHLEALLSLLEPQAAGLAAVRARFDAILQLYATEEESANPGFHLPAPLVARTAALGLGFDFDLYVFAPAEA